MTTARQSLAVMAALLLPLAINAQKELWRTVSSDFQRTPDLLKLDLSDAEKRSVVRAVELLDNFGCKITDPTGEWRSRLHLTAIHLGGVNREILVETGQGCAAGGSGGGPMWIVSLEKDHARILASPQSKFNGWIYSVQSAKSHGLRDIVVGWRMGDLETDLSYFKFNGYSYRMVSAATLSNAHNRRPVIIPNPVRAHMPE